MDEAHDIMAECYGTLGKLQSERDALEAECERLRKDRSACWAELKVMTRSCLDAEKERNAAIEQRDALAAELAAIKGQEAAGGN